MGPPIFLKPADVLKNIGYRRGIGYTEFARFPLSFPQTLFSHSLRSTICNPGHPHLMRTLRITNSGPERA